MLLADQLERLADHIGFQRIGETAFLVFFREINMDGCLLLAFGLPVFLLPEKMEGDGKWAEVLNPWSCNP